MSSKSFFVSFSINGEGSASHGLVHTKIAPGLLVVADEFLGDGDFGSVLGVKGGIDPGSPIVGLVPEIIDVEFDGFHAGNISGNFVKPLGVLGLEFWALGEIFRDER